MALDELSVRLDGRFVVGEEGALAFELGHVITLALARPFEVHAEPGKPEAQANPQLTSKTEKYTLSMW